MVLVQKDSGGDINSILDIVGIVCEDELKLL